MYVKVGYSQFVFGNSYGQSKRTWTNYQMFKVFHYLAKWFKESQCREKLWHEKQSAQDREFSNTARQQWRGEKKKQICVLSKREHFKTQCNDRRTCYKPIAYCGPGLLNLTSWHRLKCFLYSLSEVIFKGLQVIILSLKIKCFSRASPKSYVPVSPPFGVAFLSYKAIIVPWLDPWRYFLITPSKTKRVVCTAGYFFVYQRCKTNKNK